MDILAPQVSPFPLTKPFSNIKWLRQKRKITQGNKIVFRSFFAQELLNFRSVNSKPIKFWVYIRNGTFWVICLISVITAICGAYFWIPAKVHFHVIESYLFSAKNEDAEVNLGVFIPKNGPYQQIENLQINWSGSQSIESGEYLDIVKLSGEVTNNETKEAIIEYDVILSQGKVNWQEQIKDFQIMPQQGIESDCETLIAKADQIRDGTDTDDVYSIYIFTSQYLTYSLEYRECTSNSALTAYEIGSCVCMGYARLMVALNRASGIPSQMVIGYLYPDPIFSHPTKTENTNRLDEAHAWVEYYSEGSWKMADPTLASRYLKTLNFNRNYGRHLSYGEFEYIINLYAKMARWAYGRSQEGIGDIGYFRYVATSDSEYISFYQTAEVNKRWDGRYLNTIIAWAITTYFLCMFRNKLLSPRNTLNEKN